MLVVDRAAEAPPDADSLETALRTALQTMTLKDAAAHVAEKMGAAKRDIYQMALKLSERQG